jgi:hypothetical protein
MWPEERMPAKLMHGVADSLAETYGHTGRANRDQVITELSHYVVTG